MPEENNKILTNNHGEKYIKELFVIDVDIESLFEKINTFHNNPKKPSNTKKETYTFWFFIFYALFI